MNIATLQRRLPIMIGVLLLFSTSMAQAGGKAFSATAVQTTPQGTLQSRVYIDNDVMRNDYVQDKQQFVEIVDRKTGRRTLLNPAQKSYMEIIPTEYPDQRLGLEDSPCAKMPGTLCRKLENETINGRSAEKWEFTRVIQGRPVHSLHWIDKERRLPVREFLPDGSVMEMSLLGKEELNNRQTEKWRMQMMKSDGDRMQSLQWYDPELELVIREEHQGGYVRELRDIKTGKQPENLFTVPKGYTRQVAAPQPRPAPAPVGAPPQR